MSEKKTGAAIDPEIVRELAAILRDTGLTEIEVEQGETRLRLARMAAVASAPAAAMAIPAPVAVAAALPPAASEAPKGADYKSHPGAILSPMVGTAYRAAEPGAKPFVAVGDMVAEGQTVLVVEAMKTFNPIPAPRAGKVAQILVADAQPVEFGEPLIILD